MRIVFMGTPTFAVNSLEQLTQAGHEIIAVITQPDRPKGRGKKLSPPPVKEKALELGLKVLQPEKVKDSIFIEKLQQLNPQVIVVVAFGQILPKAILDLPEYGCINVHASLLPRYRGPAPIHWAIINGETESGVTTMLMDEGLDTGDMLLKARVLIDQNMTTGELHDRLAILGGQVLVETLEKLEKNLLKPEPQNHELATYAPLLTKEHEKIDWKKSAVSVHNLVRGMNPWPGAYTFIEDRRIKIKETRLKDKLDLQGQPGEVLAITSEGLWVQTGDKPLLITKVQPSGKNEMSVNDFVNGYRIKPGQIFGELNG
ncbi:MAG: methionyl-tRNA formyltransferase [Clostridia bacterium]|nr:methionyl-tRNA formyltransferase [Clostridia bacterium]